MDEIGSKEYDVLKSKKSKTLQSRLTRRQQFYLIILLLEKQRTGGRKKEVGLIGQGKNNEDVKCQSSLVQLE